MTPEEQRVCIAEACGWKPLKGNCNCMTHWEFVKDHGNSVAWRKFSELPNYLNDLNAMHEAEKTITHDQWRIYLGFVMGERTIPKLASMEEFHRAWMTTAAQRAEAFLRTIGKWKESK